VPTSKHSGDRTFVLDSPPLVSVVIPAYQVTQYIAETVASVLAQSFRDFEIIVVNDCCPDTEALNRALAPFLPHITYIRHETNRGVSAARNTGIRAACGEWIAFLDGDDLWEPSYLSVQMEALRKNPQACLVYGNARIVGSIYDGSLSQTHSPSVGPVTVASLLQETVSVASQNITRKSALIAAGLFDEALRRCEDFDLWIRIVKAGGIVIYHSEVIAKYRVHAGSLSDDSERMLESRLQVMEKLNRDPLLPSVERALLKTAERRWRAQMNIEMCRRHFAVGNNAEAIRHLGVANEYFKRPRLSLIRTMMKYCPELLRLCMRIRRKMFGF
jgi:glycosyltransferase involved in cell wall biosynthesis